MEMKKKMLVTLEINKNCQPVQLIADSQEVVMDRVEDIIKNGDWFTTEGKAYFLRGDDIGGVEVEPLPYWE